MTVSNEQVIPTGAFDSEIPDDIDADDIDENDQVLNDDDELLNNMDTPEENPGDDIDDFGDIDDTFSDDEGSDPDQIEVKLPDEQPLGTPPVADAEVPAAPEVPVVPEEPKLTKKEKFDKYSRSVQRRINKEVKQREHLREQNEILQQRLASVEKTISDNNKEQEKAKHETELNVLSNRIKNATSIKAQLLEDGDYEQLSKVDDDIIQMRIHQARLEEREQNNTYKAPEPQDQAQAPQAQQPGEQQQQQQQAETPYIPEIQKQWITSNNRYQQDTNYAQFVNNVYDELLDEGYDPEQENLYAELNKRTGTRPQPIAQVPAAQAQAPAPAAQAQAPAAQTPAPRRQAAPAPNVAQAQAHTKGGNTGITEADKVKMRNWGLNPNDGTTRAEWLRNKRKA